MSSNIIKVILSNIIIMEEEDINIGKNWIYYQNGINLLTDTCKRQKKQYKFLYIANLFLFLYCLGTTIYIYILTFKS